MIDSCPKGSRAPRHRAAVAVLAGLGVLGLAALGHALAPGEAAPDLSAAALDGKPVSLSRLRGQVVVVDFWASWCAPCKQELPFLESLYKRNRSRGLTVIGVSVDNERDNAQQFISKVKVSFPIVHDGKHAVADRFKPPRMPTSYVLDRQGKVRFVHEGYRSDDARKIEGEIETLLR